MGFIPIMMLAAVWTMAPAPADREPVDQSIIACGVDPTTASQRWDSELQSTVVHLRGATLDQKAIACLVGISQKRFIDFEFSSPELQHEYETDFEATPNSKSAIRQFKDDDCRWLKQHGLLEGALRIRDRKGSLVDKAKEIELYCGLMQGSILKVRGVEIYVQPQNGFRPSFDQLRAIFAVIDVVAPQAPVALVTEDRASP